MSNRPLNVTRSILFLPRLFAVVLTSTSLLTNFGNQPVRAQVTQYCQLSSAAAQEKENLRLSALKGNQDAETSYQNIVQKQAQELQDCRTRTWPQIQAIWLRLYPCDIKPGTIESAVETFIFLKKTKV